MVHAFDAGPVGASYFLAMEYVEGTDLARLVKQCGPLPVMHACAYIRQAALGLQHAHERGLVHRDIKPHNLILSLREGRIKVADLGLARLPRAANEEATAALTGAHTDGGLTPAGAVMMGTLDYMAPEQALDFHSADIRADIYSLGCTLWYLLIGQPPFSGGTLAEKLLSHQTKEPPAIEKLRPDVPAGLARVVRRMLAKRPENRYRSPAEVAEAVTPYICTPDARDLEFDPGGWSVRAGAYTTWQMLRKFVRRNKAFTAAVVTAMVLLAWSSVVNYQARRETQRASDKYRQEQGEKEERTRKAVPALLDAARLAVNRQRFDNALTQVDVALAYAPESAEAHLLKGQILIVQKEFAQARGEVERYLQQQPGDRNARRLVELCSRTPVDKPQTLLEFSHVFKQQDLPALAQGLLARYGRNWVETREELLKLCQARIEETWKGRGKCLALDPAGMLGLNLGQCQEVDSLTILEGMPLTGLSVNNCNRVHDLKPLRGMPLKALNISGCDEVRDLSPLKGMPLTNLNLGSCANVDNLAPLQGMLLTDLNLSYSGVLDLKPLQGMPLTSLNCQGALVSDLSPLGNTQLKTLNLHVCKLVLDLRPLKGLPLHEIWLPVGSKYSAEVEMASFLEVVVTARSGIQPLDKPGWTRDPCRFPP